MKFEPIPVIQAFVIPCPMGEITKGLGNPWEHGKRLPMLESLSQPLAELLVTAHPILRSAFSAGVRFGMIAKYAKVERSTVMRTLER